MARRGRMWRACLPASAQSPTAPIPTKFYALDAAAHHMYLSTDGGATFTRTPTKSPACPPAGAAGGGGGGGAWRRRRRANGRGWRQGGRPLVCGTNDLPFNRWRPDFQGNSQPSADGREKLHHSVELWQSRAGQGLSRHFYRQSAAARPARRREFTVPMTREPPG